MHAGITSRVYGFVSVENFEKAHDVSVIGTSEKIAPPYKRMAHGTSEDVCNVLQAMAAQHVSKKLHPSGRWMGWQGVGGTALRGSRRGAIVGFLCSYDLLFCSSELCVFLWFSSVLLKRVVFLMLVTCCLFKHEFQLFVLVCC